MQIDWFILIYAVAVILTLLLAWRKSKRIRSRWARLEEQIRQRDNAQKIGHARSLTAMLSDEGERRQLLTRIEQMEKEIQWTKQKPKSQT